MTVLKDKALVKRRSKGEQTRNQILTAAIEVLATQGIKGTTHRSIATQAQLQLSLTTYYFKDIKELVHEAFVLSSTQTVSRASAAWLPAFNLLESYSKTQLKKVALRMELADKLTEMATNYLYTKIKHHSTELAIEQLLFTEIQISPKLRELAQIHKQALILPFIKLCSYFNDDNAALDADIMLTVFTQLEYRNLVVPVDEINVDNIHKTVERLIYWILQLKR